MQFIFTSNYFFGYIGPIIKKNAFHTCLLGSVFIYSLFNIFCLQQLLSQMIKMPLTHLKT